MPKVKPLELIETKQGMAICETTPRYNVMHYGRNVGQLYFNMRGYNGSLPHPDGGNVSIGERSIGAWRAEAARINREWVEFDKAQASQDQPHEDSPSLQDRGLELGSYRA